MAVFGIQDILLKFAMRIICDFGCFCRIELKRQGTQQSQIVTFFLGCIIVLKLSVVTFRRSQGGIAYEKTNCRNKRII